MSEQYVFLTETTGTKTKIITIIEPQSRGYRGIALTVDQAIDISEQLIEVIGRALKPQGNDN